MKKKNDYLLEVLHWSASNDYPYYMFSYRYKKEYVL